LTRDSAGSQPATHPQDVALAQALERQARALVARLAASAGVAWRALEMRPTGTLAGIGALLVVATIVQGGMSERLRTTWHLTTVLDHAVSATMPLGGLFKWAVAWFPRRLPGFVPAAATPKSPFLMAMWGYFGSVALLFALYALALWWLGREVTHHRAGLRVALWVGVLVSVVAYFTPALPSHDVFAYAMSGRMMVTYHANPFFAVPGSYPLDPILQTNEWPKSATAYGPLWSVISVLVSPLVGAQPLNANLTYRALALAAHLVNLVLLVAVLRALFPDRPRWHALGLLLYAWNPLVIIEVAAGHNDVLMLTGILGGLYLIARRQRAWAMMSFGAACLLKFSAVPLVALALLGLWLGDADGQSLVPRNRAEWMRQLWPAGMVAAIMALGYLPFYIGHSLREIAAVGSIQPTSQSLARTLASSFATLSGSITGLTWLPSPLARALASAASWLNIPSLWTLVILAMMGLTTVYVLPRLRRSQGAPEALAWVYAAWMAFLCVFHILRTWYLVPLVGLAALAPVGRPLRRFTLALCASTQLEILFLSREPPFGGWQIWTNLFVLGIPLLVLARELRRERFSWRQGWHRGLELLGGPWSVAALLGAVRPSGASRSRHRTPWRRPLRIPLG
jgi:hypothetical protein